MTNKTTYKPAKEQLKVEPKDFLQLGLDKRYILINRDKNRVTYTVADKNYNFSDPEEKVRTSFYVELIQKYKYPEKRLDTEVVVPRRIPSDSADILVYEDDEQKKPYIVVECKKDGISQAEINQAVEQVFGNANSLRAKYAIVVAGNVRVAFDIAGFNPRERDKNIVSDIPIRYGKVTKYKYKKGDGAWDLQPADLKALQDKFQQCHDILWEGGKRNPAEAFDEMSKLMFCKIQDERFITPVGEYYQFQIGTYETVEEVAERIKKIYKKAREKEENVFESPIKASDEIIYSIVEKLQSVSLSGTDLDAKGKAFEKFLDRVFKGSMGQYFTPRTIVEFMVKFLGPNRYDKVIDPACGSGGFLLYAMDYVRKSVENQYSEQDARDIWRDFALKKIFGIEINSQISRVAMMNMIIHEDGHTNIENNDALEDYDKFDKRKAIEPNKYNLLLTNPPFGANIKEQEHKYLNNFMLGGKEKKRKNQKTEILFIERCLDLLAEGGRMGIVLPTGILSNPSTKYVREFIKEKASILAVINLPQFAFIPSGAGVKTCLLFLQKSKKANYPIFMGMAEHIGYDSTGREYGLNDLPMIIKEYERFKKDVNSYQGSADGITTFTTNCNELATNWDPSFYKGELAIKKFIKNSKYQVKKLSEIIKVLESGSRPKGGVRHIYDGVPSIGGEHVNDEGGFIFEKIKYIPEGFYQRIKRGKIAKDDILIVKDGATTGKVGFVSDNFAFGRAATNEHVFILRPDNSIATPKFLFYFLLSEIGQFQIKRTITGSAQGGITTKFADNVFIPLPPLSEQDEIVKQIENHREKAKRFQEKAMEELKRSKAIIKDIL